MTKPATNTHSLPTVIADIGSNWYNGKDNYGIFDAITAAKSAGADYVKFQAWRTNEFIDELHPGYAKFKQYELPIKTYQAIIEFSAQLGIKPLFTPFDVSTVKRLAKLGMTEWKISSGDIVYFDLLDAIMVNATKVYISTGNSTMAEIELLVNYLQQNTNRPDIVLLHCISKYPIISTEAGFSRLRLLAEEYPQYELGWSSHVSPNQAVSVANVAYVMGATTIEVHFTATDGPTPDACVSLTEDQLRELVLTLGITHDIINSEMQVDHQELRWMRRGPNGKRPNV